MRGALNTVFVAYGAGAYATSGLPGGELIDTRSPPSDRCSTATALPSGAIETAPVSGVTGTPSGSDINSSGSPPAAASDHSAGVLSLISSTMRRLSGLHPTG